MKKLLSTGYNDTSFNIATLLLRLSSGALMFLDHGVPKLMHYSSEVRRFYDPFHIGSQWSLLLVLFAEVFCSILIVFGLFTRLALVPLITAMAVAVFLYAKGQPFAESEMAVLYLSVFLGLMLVGPGKYSVDAAMGH